jgi:hypothetical protein
VAVVAALVVAALGLLLLAGDDGGVQSERLDVRPSTTVTSAAPTTTQAQPSVTSPSPSTSAPPVADRLSAGSRLSLDGIGPVDIGMTLEQATAAAGTSIRYGDEYPPGNSCRYARPAGGPDGLSFMVIDGRIARVDVGTFLPSMLPSPVKTVSGVGLGSTEDEVKRTYPGRIRVEPAKYNPAGHDLVYVPNDPAVRHLGMIFETDGQRVTSFRAGLAEPVAYTEGCS